MKLIKIVKIKLNMLASEALPTIQAYIKDFNFVCQEGFKDKDKDKDKDKNGISLHKKTYKVVREYLTSQFAISSRMKATEALDSIFTKTKCKKNLEELIAIRNKKLRKAQLTLLNNWSYFQLEQYITYKAMAKGIDVKYVDARYISQRCCKYGFIYRSDRKSQSDFLCIQCGFRLNANLNSSRNICSKNLVSYKDADRTDVNQPIVVVEKLITSTPSLCW